MPDMSMELAARLRSAGPKLGHDSIALRNEKSLKYWSYKTGSRSAGIVTSSRNAPSTASRQLDTWAPR